MDDFTFKVIIANKCCCQALNVGITLVTLCRSLILSGMCLHVMQMAVMSGGKDEIVLEFGES